jgi:hypothetical protein
MTVIRAQCAFQVDSADPSDVLMINPHFKIVNLPGLSNDVQGLADDLSTALNTWDILATQVTVKMYDAQHAPPNYPLATSVKRQGQIVATNINRDIAVCLSYYAGVNRPRYRGRLYVPCALRNIVPSGAFVSTASMNNVATLVPILTGLGGLDVDWVVYSRVDNTSRPVTDWFVDNSWDTQRRRGPRPTSRISGTTSEAGVPNVAGFNPADYMLSEGLSDAVLRARGEQDLA